MTTILFRELGLSQLTFHSTSINTDDDLRIALLLLLLNEHSEPRTLKLLYPVLAMPLPDHSLTINGGCNCGAVRYRVNIPIHSQRPPNPYCGTPGSLPENEKLPFICTDSCNDCRKGTGSVVPFWLITPTSMIEGSLLPRDESGTSSAVIPTGKSVPDDERTWFPAQKGFKFDSPNLLSTYLRFYFSSKDRYRGFCSRCGVGVMYQAAGLPDHFPDSIDFRLGTVDKEILEKEWMKPDRHLWWERGIPWVGEVVMKGMAELPTHGDWRCDEVAKL